MKTRRVQISGKFDGQGITSWLEFSSHSEAEARYEEIDNAVEIVSEHMLELAEVDVVDGKEVITIVRNS